MPRREFVKKSALTAAALPAAVASEEAGRKKNLFVHHVYFWLKNPGNEADTAKLIEGLESLTNISTIQMAHIGRPADTDRGVIDRSYSVSWLCFFKDEAAEEVYQKHPTHLKFVENYAHLWERVVVYDSVGPKR
jgi:Stress responsive A/B Barrel Domain